MVKKPLATHYLIPAKVIKIVDFGEAKFDQF